MGRKKKLSLKTMFSQMPRKRFSWFNNYVKSLKFFWEGNTKKSIENITKHILATSCKIGISALYRLWIECLYQDKDHAGLVALREHLILLSGDQESPNSLVGLIGTIHIYLDEYEAADLLASSYDKELDDRYMDEFYHNYIYRLQDTNKIHIPFIASKKLVYDYFHLRLLNSCLLSTNYDSELTHSIEFSKKLYGNSPMHCSVKIARQVKAGYFGRAIHSVEKLIDSYPKNKIFQSLKAPLMALNGDKKTALRIVFSLLKHEISFDEIQLANWCMLDNVEVGLPNTKSTIRKFENSLQVESSELTETKKVWLTHVNDETYAAVINHRGSNMSFKHQLTESASKGDWVIIARHTADISTTRVIGIFQIIEKFPLKIGITPNAVLDSIEIFEKSIEVSFYQDEQSEVSELMRSFGVSPVFNLDDNGLSVIFGEIEEQLIFDDTINDRLQEKWSQVI